MLVIPLWEWDSFNSSASVVDPFVMVL